MTLLLEHFDTLLATPADVEHLNRAILTLAVQGRLVAQDPGDEPASDLLKRIQISTQATKKTTVSGLVPPYDLPKSWIWTTLPELGEVNPRNHESDDTKEASFIPMTYISEDYGGELKFDIRPWGEIRKGFTHLQENDVAVAKITPCFENGKAAVMRQLVNGIGAGTTELHVFRGNPDFIVPDYVLIFFKNFKFQEDGKRKMTGSAGQQRVPKEHITQTPFPLPPLAEQKRIVARVESLFAQTRALAEKLSRAESELNALNQSALAHLLAADADFEKQWDFLAAHFESLLTRPEHIAPLRQSILELAVRGKLTRREAGDGSAKDLLKKIREEKEESGKKEVFAPVKESEKPFPLPEGWEWFRFKDIGEIYGGKTPSMNHSEYWNGDIPWVSPKDMWEDVVVGSELMITTQALDQMKLVPVGSLLVVVRSGILKRKLPVSINAVPCTVNQDLKVIAPYLPNISRYLQLMLQGLQPFILKNLVKQGTTVQSVKWEEFIDAPFPLPPLAEQARIVARVERLLGLCAALESRLRGAQVERSRLVVSVLAGVGVG